MTSRKGRDGHSETEKLRVPEPLISGIIGPKSLCDTYARIQGSHTDVNCIFVLQCPEALFGLFGRLEDEGCRLGEANDVIPLPYETHRSAHQAFQEPIFQEHI